MTPRNLFRDVVDALASEACDPDELLSSVGDLLEMATSGPSLPESDVFSGVCFSDLVDGLLRYRESEQNKDFDWSTIDASLDRLYNSVHHPDTYGADVVCNWFATALGDS